MKQSKDYAWILYIIILAIAVFASSCGTQPTEQEAFDTMWADMVSTPDSVMTDDGLAPIDSYEWVIDNGIGWLYAGYECQCFNCLDHEAGVIPIITWDAIESIATTRIVDYPEEHFVTGDTIAAYDIGEVTYICYYHDYYPQEFYLGWDVYIVEQRH